MTDIEFRKQKSRLQALSKKWFPVLGLRWWNVRIQYNRDERLADADETGPDSVCLGKASVRWQYIAATLSFDLLYLSDVNDDELENTFVHECCHVLVHEMREWAGGGMTSDQADERLAHEERVVSMLANAFIWTYKAGRESTVSRKKAKKPNADSKPVGKKQTVGTRRPAGAKRVRS